MQSSILPAHFVSFAGMLECKLKGSSRTHTEREIEKNVERKITAKRRRKKKKTQQSVDASLALSTEYVNLHNGKKKLR